MGPLDPNMMNLLNSSVVWWQRSALSETSIVIYYPMANLVAKVRTCLNFKLRLKVS